MDALLSLWDRQPLVAFHLTTAVAALALGLVILARRKGTAGHRALGWTWVLLMGSTALSTAFIRDERLPNLAGFTPIHAFTIGVAVLLPLAVWQARQGRIAAHRRTMRRMYIGGCVLAGVFTLLPGRLLGNLLWGTVGGGIVS